MHYPLKAFSSFTAKKLLWPRVHKHQVSFQVESNSVVNVATVPPSKSSAHIQRVCMWVKCHESVLFFTITLIFPAFELTLIAKEFVEKYSFCFIRAACFCTTQCPCLSVCARICGWSVRLLYSDYPGQCGGLQVWWLVLSWSVSAFCANERNVDPYQWVDTVQLWSATVVNMVNRCWGVKNSSTLMYWSSPGMRNQGIALTSFGWGGVFFQTVTN